MYTKWAVRRYHEDGLEAAVGFLEDRFSARGFRMDHFTTYVDYLIGYDLTFRRRRRTPVQFGERITISAGSGVLLTGEVARIDLDVNGYSAWLFCEELDPNWRNELRMPLIQNYVADLMGATLPEMNVGLYSFVSRVYESECYDEAASRRAARELDRIVRRLPGG